MSSNSLLQLGATFILALALVRVLERIFEALIKKMGGYSVVPDHTTTDVVSELKLMNSNHLSHIEGAIREGAEKSVAAINSGNTAVIKAITDMHLDIVKELGNKK